MKFILTTIGNFFIVLCCVMFLFSAINLIWQVAFSDDAMMKQMPPNLSIVIGAVMMGLGGILASYGLSQLLQ